jgi:hypothetical protein
MTDTTNINETEPVVKLTQLQGTLLSELSARVQLGYNVWTYSSKFTKTLMVLEELGYINWKEASSEGLVIAWFTLKGKLEIMPDADYCAPIFSEYVSKEKFLTLELETMQLRKQLATLNESATEQHSIPVENKTLKKHIKNVGKKTKAAKTDKVKDKDKKKKHKKH